VFFVLLPVELRAPFMASMAASLFFEGEKEVGDDDVAARHWLPPSLNRTR
jgi:hypothetical protein